MEFTHINHWAVFCCAAFNLVLGAVWYSPLLFYKSWLNANKLTEEDIAKNFNPAISYGLAFVISWLISYNLAFFLADESTDAIWGASAGFLAGFGFAAAIFAIVAIFEQRPWKYIVINGGYIVVYFTIIGWILGFWKA
ncbi:MAG: DUF1761 domain-containing protein [Saprospiraceae bacterium]|nr:DUF1761 domain-containing protein [Saprospiraceae bacterium]